MREAVKTGQWLTLDEDAAEGGRWWYDTGSPALDFAYVGGFEHGHGSADGPEALTTPAALDAWLIERFPGLDAAATERELADARALQVAIARILTAVGSRDDAAAPDVDIVNLFAATPDIPPTLPGGSRQAGRSRARIGQALSTLARDATEVLSPANRERIRPCDAADCDLIFFDESRSNNRRWCSMLRCGNRAKVRAHRSRSSERPGA